MLFLKFGYSGFDFQPVNTYVQLNVVTGDFPNECVPAGDCGWAKTWREKRRITLHHNDGPKRAETISMGCTLR